MLKLGRRHFRRSKWHKSTYGRQLQLSMPRPGFVQTPSRYRFEFPLRHSFSPFSFCVSGSSTCLCHLIIHLIRPQQKHLSYNTITCCRFIQIITVFKPNGIKVTLTQTRESQAKGTNGHCASLFGRLNNERLGDLRGRLSSQSFRHRLILSTRTIERSRSRWLK